jgi:tetratricopeptide (TPR) repeat protein
MTNPTRSCRVCGAALHGWNLEVCAACVVRSAIDGPPASHPSAAGLAIGAYRVIDRLDAGGMGEVFLAEQAEPRRLVAIKVLREDRDGERVVSRFLQERETIGGMDHPFIARVYDASRLSDGRPYFVMEFVDGIPITRYADARRLPLRDRLELVLDLCEAVHHAHQRGVIHRDLKPSNILVETVEGRAVPKLIDFGIAKALGPVRTTTTTFYEVSGTVGYMSPEQTLPGAAADIRSDVYGLGAVLYELLTGSPAFFQELLQSLPLDEALRRLRETDPTRPSVRAPQAARELRGDLDAITMKAMSKEPERRYGSVAELAADLRRHLRAEPVLARPQSRVYRAARFMRRHRVGMVAAAVAISALLIGAIGSSIGLVRAVRAERVATTAQGIAREQARRAAEEANSAERVTEFLVGLFHVSDPSEARGNSILAREVLDRGAQRIGRELLGEPRVQARLMDAMGRVYRNLGLFGSARPLLEDALRIRESLVPPDELEIVRSLDSTAILLRETGKPADALAMFERTLDIRLRILGRDHLDGAASLNNIASLCLDRGEAARAVRLHEQALAIREKALPADDLDLATTRMNLALALSEAGERGRAKELLERARGVFERKSPDSLDLAQASDGLGAIHADAGELEIAQPLFEQALDIRERVLGPDHPDLAGCLVNLGNVMLARGEFASARPRFEAAIRILESAQVADHRTAAIARGSLAVLLLSTGEKAASRREFLRSIEILTKLNGADNGDSADILKEYAEALGRTRHTKEARKIASQEAAMRTWIAEHEKLAPDDPAVTRPSPVQ